MKKLLTGGGNIAPMIMTSRKKEKMGRNILKRTFYA